MVMNVDVFDMRLGEVAPRHTSLAGFNVLSVNMRTRMHVLVSDIHSMASRRKEHLGILRITAHGFVDYMQLCKEGLTPFTAYSEFQVLKEVFQRQGLIVLVGCNVVDRTTRRSLLMKYFAEACNVHVLGSSALEYYQHSQASPINFGKWEGNLYVCSPDGNMTLVSTPVQRSTRPETDLLPALPLTFKGWIKRVGANFHPYVAMRVWIVIQPK